MTSAVLRALDRPTWIFCPPIMMDLLAEVAEIFLGTSEGELHEPRARNAAEFCRAAGADPDLIRGRPQAGHSSMVF
jgi:acetyl esterase/lipase